MKVDTWSPDSSDFQSRSWRWNLLYWLLGVVFLSIVSRGFYLQIIRGEEFLARAEGNRVEPVLVPAPRGIIFDSLGAQLVENVASVDIILDPRGLPLESEQGTMLDLLPGLVRVSADDVREALGRARESQKPTILTQAVDHEIVLAVEEKKKDLPGVRIYPSLTRRYLYGSALGHVLGYTGTVSSEDLEANDYLVPTDQFGKNGLEQQYDRMLHGEHGVAYTEVNAAGVLTHEVDFREARPGSDLHITLDAELQKYIEQIWREREEDSATPNSESAGAVVVLDARTGAVRALLSYPTFDPNSFSLPANRAERGKVLLASSNPLFQRAISGMYPPGSTIKPLLAAAALEEGIVTPQTTILSTGGITKGVWVFPDWRTGGHGITDLEKAIADSVNTYFYIITGGDDDRAGMGVHTSTRYLAGFGWGDKTNIDLPGEAPGFLPSPLWKEEKKGEPWYIGDTYHLGIGQGDVLVTPLQVALGTGIIANGGHIITPHLIQNFERDTVERSAISESNFLSVRSAMRATVTEGSGRSLSTLPIAVAGKTGTAQVGGTEDTHAWFTSFGPYEDPEIVVTVLLEKAGAGDEVAAPFARKIWEWWAEKRASERFVGAP